MHASTDTTRPDTDTPMTTAIATPRRVTMIATAALLATLVSAQAAHAATLVSLVGDQDGFGIDGLPDVPVNGTPINGAGTATPEIDDPDFMDREMVSPDNGTVFSYDHVLASLANPVQSASLEIQAAGMGNGEREWEVKFNGHTLGTIGPNLDGITSIIVTFNVPAAYVAASNTVSLEYTSTLPEVWFVNYSQLTVNTVPAPAASLAAGTLLVPLLSRRRRRHAHP